MTPVQLWIAAVAEGHIKQADIDPIVQWGLLGGGAGAGASLLRTALGGGDDDTEGSWLARALKAGLLGAGVGAGITGGARLFGAQPKDVAETLKPKEDVPVSPSVGLGVGGAAVGAGATAANAMRSAQRGVTGLLTEREVPALPGDTKSPRLEPLTLPGAEGKPLTAHGARQAQQRALRFAGLANAKLNPITGKSELGNRVKAIIERMSRGGGQSAPGANKLLEVIQHRMSLPQVLKGRGVLPISLISGLGAGGLHYLLQNMKADK